jgi:cold shock CspA family protein
MSDNTETKETRIQGRIIKIDSKGFGFITTKDIPFTRIFFHWTSLRPDTLKFQELRSGMKVSFVAFEVEDKGFRAIKIKVED